MMDAAIKAAILAHAKECFPKECCGLLVVQGDSTNYWPCHNQADGDDHFILDPADYAEADAAGEIVGVVHSHPNVSPKPSQADLVACEASGVPWHIVSYPAETWETFAPSGFKAPLIGRVWSHGVLDCYSLVRDWYLIERGVELPDFARSDKWWKKGENLYLENFAKAGFVRVTDGLPQHGDVLLLQMLSPVPNHAGIFLQDNKILHHLHDRLSCREQYPIGKGYYWKHTTHILRHNAATDHISG